MIDEKKLIEVFRKLKGTDTLANMFISDVIKEIKKQPKIGEWIPCSERLPERSSPVMVYAESTTISGGAIIMTGSCHNGFWFIQNGTDTLGFPTTGYQVTAWQPLPEPPEGG